jgi:hypothetical protein
MKFYGFPELSILSSGYDFYSINEFPWILVVSLGCDFCDVFYSLPSFSTNSNLS